jgi:hypothetical protein
VRAGLATARAENVVTGRLRLEIARVKITEAGRAWRLQTGPSDDPKAPRLSTPASSEVKS